MPVERQGARNDLADLVSMIASGMSDYQIIQEMPEAMLQLDKISQTRQVLISETARKVWRDISVMLSRLVDTFFSRTSWTMLLYAENHSISVA